MYNILKIVTRVYVQYFENCNKWQTKYFLFIFLYYSTLFLSNSPPHPEGELEVGAQFTALYILFEVSLRYKDCYLRKKHFFLSSYPPRILTVSFLCVCMCVRMCKKKKKISFYI